MANTTLEKWEEKTLHEVLNKVKYTSKIQSKLYKDKGKYPIISQEDVFISGYWDNPSDVYHVKHPIVIFGDHTKVVKYIDFDFVLGADGVKILDPTKDINAKFLYYWTKYVPLRNLGYARHYKLLSEKTIHFPSLPEQERIVAKLDEAFEAIDKVKANAEQNLNNAKELFESALNNVFTKNTDGWEEKKLDDVCTYKSGTTISKDLEKDTGDLLYIKVGDMNIRGNEELITTSTRFASSAEISAAQIIPTGSVIFPKRGGAIATNKKRKIIKPTIVDLNTMAIIPNKELDSNFFYYWFGQINLIDISNGTTIPQINNYSFQNLRIKYPTLLEQQKIVEQLDKIQEKTKKLEAIYTQKIKECDELKQSILQKAFRGEL